MFRSSSSRWATRAVIDRAVSEAAALQPLHAQTGLGGEAVLVPRGELVA